MGHSPLYSRLESENNDQKKLTKINLRSFGCESH